MKNVIIISFIFCCCLGFTQQQSNALMQEQMSSTASDTLHWSKDRKLTWDDFQGVPVGNSPSGASTSSGFVTKSNYTSATTISVIITAVFYKNKSWVKSNSKDDYGLNHEQVHFDITELYARKATAVFKKYKYSKETVNKDIDSIVNFYFSKMSEMEDLYDKETNHSLNKAKQRMWYKKIVKLLAQTENR